MYFVFYRGNLKVIMFHTHVIIITHKYICMDISNVTCVCMVMYGNM